MTKSKTTKVVLADSNVVAVKFAKKPSKPVSKPGTVTKLPVKKAVATPAKATPSPAVKPTAKTRKYNHLSDTMKITVVSKDNPYREGTPAHKAWGLFKTGQSVTAYLAVKGSARKWLRKANRKGFIKVS